MRRFTIIVLCCFIVFVLSCLLFGARETVYFLSGVYVVSIFVGGIIFALGYVLLILRRKRNDPE